MRNRAISALSQLVFASLLAIGAFSASGCGSGNNSNQQGGMGGLGEPVVSCGGTASCTSSFTYSFCINSGINDQGGCKPSFSGGGGCSTGVQTFDSRDAECAGLQSDSRNSGCELEGRQSMFKASCPGTFTRAN